MTECIKSEPRQMLQGTTNRHTDKTHLFNKNEKKTIAQKHRKIERMGLKMDLEDTRQIKRKTTKQEKKKHQLELFITCDAQKNNI